MATVLSKRFIIISFVIFLLALLAFYILPLSVPLIVAFITALFLEPAVRLLQERFSFKRQLAVLTTFLIFLLLLGLCAYFISTKVITEVVQVAQNTPMYINEINNLWLQMKINLTHAAQNLPPGFVDEASRQVDDFLNKIRVDLASYLNIENVKSIITNIPNFLVSFLVYLIALFLFMIDLPKLKEKFYSHLTEKTADKVQFMSSRLSHVVFGFCKAQFLVSVLIFVVTLIGLFIIAPEIALVMSFVIWIIDLIPIIGSIVILAPWSLFHLAAGNVALGTKLAILAAILLIIRRTVEPKIMGSHIGLSPLSTLITMFLGLKLFGILGFIIGPLTLIAFNSAREAGIIKTKFKI
ncbi:sporulation integral membrane protein YtvI [Metabacillus iocasae]|uniref:Sporulation integral membrane protein YtvI n=1 Tax=Priestia iocasae TaxID=2291674 RepID=A0ABS2QWL8_9BACI|nr:sporulation integral membrane protein YtvI [Metabacillus iocasae]MBM7703347.1 sporulation integral membrane protein YtvI [Metabacillus iocasae]